MEEDATIALVVHNLADVEHVETCVGAKRRHDGMGQAPLRQNPWKYHYRGRSCPASMLMAWRIFLSISAIHSFVGLFAGNRAMAVFEIGIGSIVGPFVQGIGRVWAWFRGRRGQLTNADIVQIRMKWKPQFESRLAECRREKLRQDVIVRDVRRLDGYPSVDEKAKGISPWFRVGLVGIYHAGILLHLGWRTVPTPVLDQLGVENWHQEDSDGQSNTALIGYVPYEQIEAVDWEGDEFYGFPVIYCHFDTKRGEPYERIAFSYRRVLSHPGGDIEFYTDMADADQVRKTAKKLSIELW